MDMQQLHSLAARKVSTASPQRMNPTLNLIINQDIHKAVAMPHICNFSLTYRQERCEQERVVI